MIGYSDSTWAEDMAPQGCDQSADPAAGNAWAARAAFAAFLAGKRYKSREREGRALAVFKLPTMLQLAGVIFVRQLFGPHLSTCP